jgi:hypothetical protein
MENIKQYVQNNKERFLNELIDLLKIPSVSADSAYAQDVIDTANAVKASLEKAGCDVVELCETPGYPIVFGEKIIDKSLPTVLVYGHYSRLIRWNCGLHLLLSRLSKQPSYTRKVPFLHAVPVMTKDKCTCM